MLRPHINNSTTKGNIYMSKHITSIPTAIFNILVTIANSISTAKKAATTYHFTGNLQATKDVIQANK